MVAMAVVAMLFALLMPALMAAREGARRTTCASHLRQIGVAIQHYHDRAGQLPVAWRPVRNDARFAFGWATQILPELEQSGYCRQIGFQNRPAASFDPALASLPLLLCPSDITEPVFELWQGTEPLDSPSAATSDDDAGAESSRRLISLPTSNYPGVFGSVEADEALANVGSPFGDGSIIHDGKVRWQDLQRGLSNTLLVGERTMAMVPSTWLGVDLRGDDAPCRLVGSAISRPNCSDCDECEFGSRHVGGSAFAWADGHVALLHEDIDSVAYQRLAKRSAD